MKKSLSHPLAQPDHHREIERKFLATGQAWKGAPSSLICQGYPNRDPKRTVRIRIDGTEAWITLKGITMGATRTEFEYGIPLKDAPPAPPSPVPELIPSPSP